MVRVKNTLLLLSVILVIVFIAVCFLPLSGAADSVFLTGIEAAAAVMLLCGAICCRTNEKAGDNTADMPCTDGSDTDKKDNDTITGRNAPVSEHEKKGRTTENMRALSVHVSDIAAHCDNPELNKRLSSLAENFQYSDPVSIDSLFKIESEMEVELTILERLIRSDKDRAIEQIEKINRMLAQRNELCKMTKRSS